MRALILSAALCLVSGPALAGSAEITRGDDGHWTADARVNGRPVEFLVDTGATMVALTADDARKAGIDLRRLDYRHTVRTASGTARAAAIKLERVQVGTVRLEDVDALVIERGLSVSLLGQSFLNRLERIQTRGAVLRLQD